MAAGLFTQHEYAHSGTANCEQPFVCQSALVLLCITDLADLDKNYDCIVKYVLFINISGKTARRKATCSFSETW